MATIAQDVSATVDRPRRRFLNPVPLEGENGLFSQTWYPICLSSDLPVGGVLGVDFLDGRVVAFRGDNGEARVMSAYCPHVGADLSHGDVCGNAIRCPFHHWEFDQDGWCNKTGVGDPPPMDACLFNFPVAEAHGLVWAFNGDTPSFEIPWFRNPPAAIAHRVGQLLDYENDPWTLCSNSPDYFHFQSLHRLSLELDIDTQSAGTTWSSKGLSKRWRARLEHGAGPEYEFISTVVATNIVLVEALELASNVWTGVIAAQAIVRPQRTRVFPVAFVESRGTSPSDLAEQNAMLDLVCGFFTAMGKEDIPLLGSMRYAPGYMTKQDALLSRYLQLVRNWPRAHPSAEFIRSGR